MNKIGSVSTAIVVVLSLCSCVSKHKDNSVRNDSCAAELTEEIVYVCTGPKATAYHYDDYCPGLSRCSRSVEAMTMREAEEELGRTKCGICW